MKIKRVDEEEDKKWLVKLLDQIDGYEYSWLFKCISTHYSNNIIN
jgi:hypothetical protein